MQAGSARNRSTSSHDKVAETLFGKFVFTNISNGTYTVVPSKAGFSFSPNNLPATVNGGDVTGINFTTSTAAFNITGTVSPHDWPTRTFIVGAGKRHAKPDHTILTNYAVL